LKTRTTRYVARTVRLTSLSALVVLGGCMSLGRGEPPQQHYVLGGGPPMESAPPSLDLSHLTIGVRRLQLAPYLETPFILVRRGPNQIGFSEFHRWGETLSAGINRAVVGYLGDRASFRAVDVAPWPSGERYDYVIQLHVQRFEGVSQGEPSAVDGEVLLLASWEIIRQLDGTVLKRGATEYRESGWTVGDYAGLVTLLDAGLHALTDELLGSLDELDVATAAEVPAPTSPAPPPRR
jgi:uncharacterized lipoprotein YmbA